MKSDEDNDTGKTWRLNKPFVGISTFLRAPYVEDTDQLDADIAVFGVARPDPASR